MPAPTIAETLKFANLQMATEALFTFDATQAGVILTPGDKLENPQTLSIERFANILTRGNLHASTFTSTEAAKFAEQWRVVEHISNTTTGFSGTLFIANKDDPVSGIKKDDLVLSFRSTEFLDDHARDNTATNFLEISKFGFAFGQIADMENWYQSLIDRQLITGPLSVTGYSLGGHLATAFNLLHQNELNGGQVMLFNGAGVGKIGTADGTLASTQAKLREMVSTFATLRTEGDTVAGLAARLQTDEGRTAYHALKTALAGTQGVPDADMVNIVNRMASNAPNEPRSGANQADYLLLWNALDRALAVKAAAHRAPTLGSGSTEGPPNPANIQDLYTRPDGSQALAIAGESLDYQLAVLLTHNQFKPESRISIAAARGTPKPGDGGLLPNQWDIVGSETTTPPWYGVAYSQYRYGNDVKLFIEDQPITRGDFIGAFIDELLQGNIQLLHPNYALNDFGDTHNLVLIVDSLNVQNTLLNLVADKPSATKTLNTILENASWRKAQPDSGQGQAEGDVLENVVNALADLFLPPQAKADRLNGSPVGNTWWDTTDQTVGDTAYTGRDKFYEKLKAIAESPIYKTGLAGKLTLKPSTAIRATAARTDFGAYAALYSLSPFVFSTGDVAVFDAAFGDASPLYAAWKADKDALAAGKARDELQISDAWLADRAAMLVFKNDFNNRNIAPYDPAATEGTGEGITPKIAPIYFEDIASDYKIQQGRLDGGTARRFIFGDDTANTDIAGGRYDDHLYGGAGNDSLSGNDGDDRLEGGADVDTLLGGSGSDTLVGGKGNDILEGGEGDDIYIINSGDGHDTIIDSGANHIKYNGKLLAGSFLQGDDGKYRALDGQTGYTFKFNSPGVLSLDDTTQIVFQNQTSGAGFADGDFGLHLIDAVGSSQTTRTIDGDLILTEYTATLAPGAPYGADWRNVTITHTTYTYDEDDNITGVASRDLAYNKIDDLGNLIGSPGGANRDDSLNGSADADLLRGRVGDDLLLGNGGNDRLEAGIGDDIANGADNDDQLVGDDGSDILLGGAGKDTLHGGIEVALDQLYEQGETLTASGNRGDWLDAGADDDILAGERGHDVLLGAEGADILLGGVGDDVLQGDATGTGVARDWILTPIRDAAQHSIGWHWNGSGGFSQVAVGSGGADALYGGAGNDVMNGGDDDDYLDGGSDDDFLWGSQGADMLLGQAGNDQLFGDNTNNDPAQDGADYLDGGEGNDYLTGMGGADELFGGADDDEMEGDFSTTPTAYHGDDYLDGEAGNDTLRGDGGKDALFGGTGNDSLRGDSSLIDSALHGVDYLDGEEGDDTLIGDGGDDNVIGGTGNDQLFGDSDQTEAAYQGADDLEGGEGDDYLRGYGGNDTLSGGAGADQLLAEAGDDVLEGGADDDILDGGEGKDTLAGGAGADALTGGAGDDTYLLEVGAGGTAANGAVDAIYESGGKDTVRFGAGIAVADILTSRANLNDLLIEVGTDRLVVQDGIKGVVETFEFADGTSYSYAQLVGRTWQAPVVQSSSTAGVQIVGGTQTDSLYTAGGDATVSGGRGNDDLQVYGTNNTILYSVGDGADRVLTHFTANPGNVLKLSGVTADQLKLGLGSLVLQVGSDPTDTIHFERFTPNDVFAQRPFERIEFDPAPGSGQAGSTLTYDELMAKGFDIAGTAEADLLIGTNVDDRISGAAGDDRIDAGAGDDVLAGEVGNDVLEGGTGDDTYRFDAGSGLDTVIDVAGINAIDFGAGLSAASMTVSQGVGDDGQRYLDLDFGNGDCLSIREGELDKVQSFRFADGTTLTTADLLATMPSVNLIGEEGADILQGHAGNDLLLGQGGDDMLDGAAGNDMLAGGAGNDTLSGGDGTDWLGGEAGDDQLAGGAGVDTYLFGTESGRDTVVETAGEQSVLQLGVGASAANLRATRAGDDLLLKMDNGVDSVRLAGYYTDANAGTHWQVALADGTQVAMADFLATVGQAPQSVAAAYAGYRDAVRGDVAGYLSREGYQLEADGSWHFSATTVVQSGADTTMSSTRLAMNGVVFEAQSGADLQYPATFARDEWAREQTSAVVSSVQRAVNTTGRQDFGGGDAAPYFVPSAALSPRHEVLLSLSFMNQWERQQAEAGGNFDNHWTVRRKTLMIPPWSPPAGAITSQVMAADGTLLGVWVTPPASQPILETSTTTQIMDVGTRTMTIPELTLGAGNDDIGLLAHGMVDGGAGNDVLRAGFFIDGEHSYPSWQMHGGGLLYGNDGNDFLSGTTGFGFQDGDNVLIGGRGRDVLVGGGGADTFMLLEEDSVDYISDVGSAADHRIDWRNNGEVIRADPALYAIAGNDYAALEPWYGSDILPDTLIFGGEAGAGSVSIFMSDSPPENHGPWYDPVLQIMAADGTGAQIALARADDAAGTGIEYVEFADGTRLSIGEVVARLDQDQDVHGSTLHDVIRTGAGDDRIDGGAGSDVLAGGGGNDTYVIGRNTGLDTIDQGNAGAADADVIEFTADVTPGEVTVSQDEAGLTLRVSETGAGALVAGRSAASSNVTVRFADGTVWDAAVLHSKSWHPTYWTGTSGDDTIHVVAGQNVINGLEGRDWLYGNSGIDVLEGGRGNDILVGEGGADIYRMASGDGWDQIYEYSALADERNVIQFAPEISAGDIRVFRDAEGLTIVELSTGDGMQWHGPTSAVNLEFADGTRWDAAVLSDPTIPQLSAFRLGQDWVDAWPGTDGIDLQLGMGGNDGLYGGAGNDLLIGGQGDDYYQGGAGNDTFVVGRGLGSDGIVTWDAAVSDMDTVRFATGIAATDVTASRRDNNLYLTINDTGETTTVWEWYTAAAAPRVVFADGTELDEAVLRALPLVITGTEEANTLYGSSMNDRLYGLGGSDNLLGQDGDDLLDGGSGDDWLYGGAGNDTFVVGRGGGNDGVLTYDAGTGDADTVLFASGVAMADVTALRRDDDLLLTISDTGETTTVYSWFSVAPAPRIAFADGGELDAAALRALPQTIIGTAADDWLYGTAADEVLWGLGGDDYLRGGAGNDTYRYGRGDGADTLDQTDRDLGNGESDVLLFGEGITPDDVVVSASIDHLVFTTDDGGSVTVAGWSAGGALASVRFADGTAWTADEVENRIIVAPGSEDDDYIFGNGAANVIDGLAGDDAIHGLAGADLLRGDEGNDYLSGGAGNDLIEGGPGNDFLAGGPGNDVYVFNRGDGWDSIHQYEADEDDVDVLRFGAGIVAANVAVGRSGDGLALLLGMDGDGVLLSNWFDDDVPLAGVEFADGSSWDAEELAEMAGESSLIVGSSGSDELDGTEFGDTMYGLAGTDWIFGYAGNDQIYGGTGNDGLYGDAGNDLLVGGAGDDRLKGGLGNDVYLFHRGDGDDRISNYVDAEDRELAGQDVIQFGGDIVPDEVRVFAFDDEGELAVGLSLAAEEDGSVTIRGDLADLPAVHFADGKEWDGDTLRAMMVNTEGSEFDDLLVGTGGGDVLRGGAGYDTIFGLGGDDTLSGGGNGAVIDGGEGGGLSFDWLRGGAGDDVYEFDRGDGKVRISNLDAGDDVIRFGAGIVADDATIISDGVYVLSIADTADSINIESELTTLPRVEFADGTVWDRATLIAMATGNVATAGDDLLAGTAAYPVLDGGEGNDTYFVGSGPAVTHIADSAGWDTLILDGLTPDNIELGVGSLKITVKATGQEIHLDDFDPDEPYAEGGIEYFGFAGDRWYSKAELIDTLGFRPTGTGGDDALSGTSLDDVITGLGGNDTLRGRGGNDTYHYALGDGHDHIVDGSGSDRVVFGAGISADDITARADAGDIVLTLAAGAGSIRFARDGASAFAVERLEFADGTAWTGEELEVKYANTAPLVMSTVAAQMGTQGREFRFTVPDAVFYDADPGDSLSYSATLADGSSLPAWLAFDAQTRAFYGTPGAGDTGAVSVRLTATDRERLSAATDFTLAIGPRLAGTASSDTLDYSASHFVGVPLIDGGVGNDAITGSAGADIIVGGAGTDNLKGEAGDDRFLVTGTDAAYDRFEGGAGYDIVQGSSGDDTIRMYQFTGSATVEKIDGNGGNDIIAGTTSSDTLDFSATELVGIGLIDGGLGNDAITGSAGNDIIVGGAGTDNLKGEAGDDIFVVTGSDAGYDRFEGGAGYDIVQGSSGDDTIRMYQFTGSATVEKIDGNGGNDIIAGTTSSDTLDFSATELVGISLIDGGLGNDAVTGSTGNDIIVGGSGTDNLKGEAGDDIFVVTGSDAGYDRFEGGAGYDIVQGSSGDDTIRMYQFTGSATVEKIAGGGGVDIIAGTTSSDTLDFSVTELVGISLIDGGLGNDAITGSAGNDIIAGGVGSDNLKGSAGDDVFLVTGTDAGYDRFEGGEGYDVVQGSSGDDTFRMYQFTGTATVEKIDGNGGNDIIAGTTSSDTLDFSGTELVGISLIDGGLGNDVITGSAGADIIVGGAGTDNLKGEAGDDSFLVTGSDAAYDRFEGGDGYDIVQGSSGDDTIRLYQYTGTATVEKIAGGGGFDVIAGTTSSDTLDFSTTELVGISLIDGGLGNDAITGSAGNDVIVGGAGTDNLKGEAGDDSFLVTGSDAAYDRFEGGDGYDIVQGSAGDDTIRLYQYTGAATVEKIAGGGGNDIIAGTGSSDTLDFSATELAGISLIDGGTGNDAITGSAGNDIIGGGAGADRLTGGQGNDTYRLGRGDGADTIIENDSTAANIDAAEFLAGIGREQIWLRHAGNNLEAGIIGTGDKLIVQNWYLGEEYRIEEFRTADGGLLLDSQVENLVQAMAAFAPPGAGQTTLPPAYQEALAPVIAANWQ